MKKILVVVDMQNDFIDGALGSKEAAEIVEKVNEKINEYKAENVIFTRDTHNEDYLNTQEGEKLPVKHCVLNTKGWEISDKLDVRSSNIIDKSSFGSLELADYVKNLNPSVIELIGLCTDICVISNAMILKAGMPETKIAVDASCCAGVTPDSHENALAAMRMCQIDILNGGSK